jgi:O-antigen ligase
MHARGLMEIDMYIGGGILGTILIIALIIFLLRRA